VERLDSGGVIRYLIAVSIPSQDPIMRYAASVTEVARNFADYFDRVAFRGERFVLTRGGRAVAELRPVPVRERLGDLSALLDSLPRLGPNDAASFEADLAAARARLGSMPALDLSG
jgi:antitoxin (DNA-binding transcriptional repressor) of toxin-antitoxin stability system